MVPALQNFREVVRLFDTELPSWIVEVTTESVTKAKGKIKTKR